MNTWVVFGTKVPERIVGDDFVPRAEAPGNQLMASIVKQAHKTASVNDINSLAIGIFTQCGLR
jgi:hypothetical protein